MFTNSKSESDFFISHINDQHRVLEYGSGESTIEISKLCKFILSIEHNANWYNKVRSVISDNINILLKESNEQFIEGFADGSYDQFKNYITSPLEHGPFDIILIDGRARIECAKFVKNVAHENTIVFIHDFTSRLEIDNYKEVFNYLDLIESVGDMSKFKIKK